MIMYEVAVGEFLVNFRILDLIFGRGVDTQTHAPDEGEQGVKDPLVTVIVVEYACAVRIL